jgi:hypothetical protein
MIHIRQVHKWTFTSENIKVLWKWIYVAIKRFILIDNWAYKLKTSDTTSNRFMCVLSHINFDSTSWTLP